MFRKSGSWRDYHSDSVLVWDGDGRRYILVGLIQSRDGGEILKKLVPVAEKLVRTSHDEQILVALNGYLCRFLSVDEGASGRSGN